MVLKVCARSQGQPVPGVRSAAMIARRSSRDLRGRSAHARRPHATCPWSYRGGLIARNARRAIVRARTPCCTSQRHIASIRPSSRRRSCAPRVRAGRTSTRCRPPCSCRFDVRRSPSLPEAVRERLREAGGQAPDLRRRHRHHSRSLPQPGAQPRGRARAPGRADPRRRPRRPSRAAQTKPPRASKVRRARRPSAAARPSSPCGA